MANRLRKLVLVSGKARSNSICAVSVVAANSVFSAEFNSRASHTSSGMAALCCKICCSTVLGESVNPRSSNWLSTADHAKYRVVCWAWVATPRSTRIYWLTAARVSSSAKRVLPTPGAPSTMPALPVPACRSSNAWTSSARSERRPTKVSSASPCG